MHAVIGTKQEQTQKFLTDGTRIPVTVVATKGNPVVMIKTLDKDGYWAVQLGYGAQKHPGKSILGHVKKAQLDKAPSFLKEVRLTDKQAESLPEVGTVVMADTVLEAGDIVDVAGFSKGKGFAGGVKRYHFRGGPKTHGQSDRHRAPGSIGSGTTPGRVYKGKRMAGKMGNDTVTLKNLEIVKVGTDFVWVKGVVPGVIGAEVTILATGKKNKKFVEVMKTQEELEAAAVAEAKAAEERIAAEKQAAEDEKARLAAEEEAKKAAAEAEAEAAKVAAEAEAAKTEESKGSEASNESGPKAHQPLAEKGEQEPVAEQETSNDSQETKEEPNVILANEVTPESASESDAGQASMTEKVEEIKTEVAAESGEETK